MTHLRAGRGPALLALSVLLAAFIPAAALAQSDDDEPKPTTPLIFRNTLTDAERDNGPDEKWQALIIARTLSGCVSEEGVNSYSSTWIGAGDEAAALFGLDECVYEIHATLRDDSVDDGCEVTAQVAWGASPQDTDYRAVPVLSHSRPAGEIRLLIRRAPGAACRGASTTNFRIDPAKVVAELPGSAADDDLAALAIQAARTAEFLVAVVPDYDPGEYVPLGCEGRASVTVPGDGEAEGIAMGRAAEACKRRAVIVNATPPFVGIEGEFVDFEDTGGNILVDISSLATLNNARISIVQNVLGSLNRGSVSYAVTRHCGDVSPDTPAAAPVTVPLNVGRFTVHSPAEARFGPAYTYPAVAADARSDELVGCEVTSEISGIPSNCTLDGDNPRSLTWTVAEPLERFDFVFDITCVSPSGEADLRAVDLHPVGSEVGPAFDMFVG